MNRQVAIVGGSSAYGGREAYYEVVDDRLILLDEGDPNNLAGMGAVVDFSGLSVEQAKQKIDALNSEGSGHEYDGCHDCTLSFWLDSPVQTALPEWLTYTEPQEAAIIRAALDVYHKRSGAFRNLKAAIRAAQ